MIEKLNLACTRILWPTKKATIVGRTMDWIIPTFATMIFFPRGS